jgi:hypothetical protein
MKLKWRPGRLVAAALSLAWCAFIAKESRALSKCDSVRNRFGDILSDGAAVAGTKGANQFKTQSPGNPAKFYSQNVGSCERHVILDRNASIIEYAPTGIVGPDQVKA